MPCEYCLWSVSIFVLFPETRNNPSSLKALHQRE